MDSKIAERKIAEPIRIVEDTCKRVIAIAAGMRSYRSKCNILIVALPHACRKIRAMD